ncbi:MAG: hypothetical protein HY858_13945 [Candidatus Solibacter usitatus]|nr:hypothetical protein [Candidatus Solibacter usitatus]
MRQAVAVMLAAAVMQAAEIPVTRVVLYKNGVAYYERTGQVQAGEAARLDFKAAEMDDVLKSLVVDAGGAGVARVRYELSEPLQRKLAEQGIQIPAQAALAPLLDQWKGARIEMKYRGEALAGTIVSGRLAPLANQAQRQELTLVAEGGELRLVDLDAATGLKLADAKLQQQLMDALAAMAQSRSRDKRAVFIDTTGAAKLTARYLTPAAVWKSSYRLSLAETGDTMLEGWAIVDNASGEDWTNVDLTVVSGKPVSFISRLYEPKFLQRPEASLPEEMAVAPMLYEGALRKSEEVRDELKAKAVGGVRAGVAGAMTLNATMSPPPPPAPMMMSSVAVNTAAREVGELFEYRFSTPVTAKKGESMLLPFVQQKVGARKLLVYSDRSQLNPRNAAEISNITGKTLDGGPLTVYQGGGYAGEALMETLKAGDKRLISYAVDQGTRVTTNFDSGEAMLRSVKAQRGVLLTRSAMEVITTYSIDNVDSKEKTLLVEHPVTPDQKLMKPKADETSANRYRFAVKLAPKAAQKLAVVEEREIEESLMVGSMTPDVLLTWTQSKAISAAAKQQLQGVLAKKSEIATADNEWKRVEGQMNEIGRDQERLRQNINTLNRVEGQQAQVTRYAAELAKGDGQLAQLRDRQSELRKRRAALETELNAMIEKLEF